MSDAALQFSNRVGQELFDLLRRRLSEEMAVPTNFDAYSAALGASLIAVAEVLRDPVGKGGDPDKFVAFAARWLRTLLAQARPGTKT
jgi:hypothetical protein